MKLVEIKLKNFRGYKEETTVTFDDLTLLIGRNDAGKSSILDALNIFFNNANIDNGDASIGRDSADVRISCVFLDYPYELVLDEQHPTSLEKEYLLREDGKLEICRIFNCASTKCKESKVFAKAYHPNAENYSDLLSLKITELKKKAKDLNVDLSDINQTIKTNLRQAIWSNSSDLKCDEVEVDLTKETGKTIWDQIRSHLPVFALFKSDRTSTDQDEEAQDPMKAAIKETLKQHEGELNNIVGKIKEELQTISYKTVQKIQEMSPDLAGNLKPEIKNRNWDSLFSISLFGDEDIPINKRGSGTRRLILLNFFRAKAEEISEEKGNGIIYAIEEPETSQHPNHQLMLLDAFQTLVESGNTQVILTTHTPTLARRVDRNSLRLIKLKNKHPEIYHGKEDETLKLIKTALGVLPDHDVKVFFGVEGKWDEVFLKKISKILNEHDTNIPNLDDHVNNSSLVFIPLGGSSLELWTCHRLASFDRPEIYLIDRDEVSSKKPKYSDAKDAWEKRGCKVFCTEKRELENYIHPKCIQKIASHFPDIVHDSDDVPELLAKALRQPNENSINWEDLSPEKRKKLKSNAKLRLNTECIGLMNRELLKESDPKGEIIGWLKEIGEYLKSDDLYSKQAVAN